MPEHRIRLRGGWEWYIAGTDTVRRVELPFDWPSDANSPVRLVRKFGRPRHDPAEEAVWLEMLTIPGLVAVSLNGRRLSKGNMGRLIDWSIVLDKPLLPRNELVLDVHPEELPIPGWGSIALVIAPR